MKKPFVVLFVAVVLIQTWMVFTPVKGDLIRVWKTIGQPAYWRSANFNQNQRFANYITFLKEHIPEDSQVVLSPRDVGPRVVGHTAYMQYFLEPREVINCTNLECLEDLSRSDSFLLVFEPELFPGTLVIESPQRLLMFDESWGVLLPEGENRSVIANTTKIFSGFAEIAAQMILPLFWLGILISTGFLFVSPLIKRWGLFARLSLGFGFSLGLVSISIFLLLLFQVDFTSRLIVLVTMFWFAASLLFFFWQRTVEPQVIESIAAVRNRIDYWHTVFILLGLTVAIVSVGMSYRVTDAIVLWAAKGYGIADHGLAAGVTEWGTYTTKYPLNIILTIAMFKEMFGEMLPASKLLYPGFYLGLLFILYDHLQQSMNRARSGLAVMLFATVPIIFEHASRGTTNLSLGYYQVAATILVSQTLRGKNESAQKQLVLLGGIFFALAAWTRPEGFVVSAVFIAILAAIGLSQWRKNQRWGQIVRLMMPLCMFAAVWGLTSPLIYTRPTGTQGFISTSVTQMIAGNIDFDAAHRVIQYTLNSITKFQDWGLLGPSAILLLIAGYGAWRKNVSSLGLIITGIAGISLIMLMMYMVTYATLPTCDVKCMLRTALDRFSIPGVALLWVGLVEKMFRS